MQKQVTAAAARGQPPQGRGAVQVQAQAKAAQGWCQQLKPQQQQAQPAAICGQQLQQQPEPAAAVQGMPAARLISPLRGCPTHSVA